jgi:Cell Wall Hydrolase
MVCLPKESPPKNKEMAVSIVIICAVGVLLGAMTPPPLIREDLTNRPLTITESDLDVMVRTTIGEAANEPDIGKIAVAWVILNRARINTTWYGGNSVASVALHKASVVKPSGRRVTVWQFEPWMNRSGYLWGIQKHGALYQHVKRLVVGCINGTYPDPTSGATHFLEPNIVRSRTGGTLPKWAQGNGRRIGRHVFYKPYQPTV